MRMLWFSAMRMRELELLVPPPVLLVATALLMWLVAAFTTFARIEIPARVPIGSAALAAGLLIDLCGAVQFLRARTTINPMKIDSASALVTTGLYRFSRNPMYVGQVLLLAAWALYLTNALSMVVLPVFVAWLQRFQIVPEERALEAKFGQAFRSYRKRVRRWL